MLPKVSRFLAERAAEGDRIPADRRGLLDELAAWIRTRRAEGVPARVVFICTHNSRRSQLAQVWAKAAADWLGVGDVETFSGGTEATAFNPRAVAALERAGLETTPSDNGANPVYLVRYGETSPSIRAFSKVYDDPANPSSGFCAVMTCSDADGACPIVHGAAARIPITYRDPKEADGAPEEEATYDERSHQIAREMIDVMTRVRG